LEWAHPLFGFGKPSMPRQKYPDDIGTPVTGTDMRLFHQINFLMVSIPPVITNDNGSGL
jgi:hypothetical protein